MSDPQLLLTNAGIKTREEVVVDAIRIAILRGTFKPGEKLDQQELAHSLNVSRSPIREALRTLAAEELVTIIPHRGVIVTERSIEELEELFFMRALLEGAAARRAAPCMTDTHLETMLKIIEAAENTTVLEETLGLNNEFHATIYQAYHQPHLLDLIQRMRNKVAPYNRIYLDMPGRKTAAWSDHRRIYDACCRRDGELAELETRKHLEQVFAGVLAAVERKSAANQ